MILDYKKTSMGERNKQKKGIYQLFCKFSLKNYKQQQS